MATWRVSSSPLLTLEGADQPLNRVAGTTRLSDGRIVVAEIDTRQLHYFAPNGSLLKSVGGRGKGPGEFAEIDRMERHDGELIIYDGRVAMHFMEATSGRFLEVRRLAAAPGFIVNPAVGVLPDRHILVAARGASRAAGSVGRDSLALFIQTADSSGLLKWFPLPNLFRVVGLRATYAKGFSPTTRFAVRGKRVCQGFTARYEIQCAVGTGEATVTIVRDLPVRTVTERERNLYRRAHGGFLEDGSNRYQDPSLREHRVRVASQTVFETKHPAFFDLLASQTGALWVREYTPADGSKTGRRIFPSSASTWNVFDEKGVWQANAQLPAGFLPMEVGTDYVLGVAQDEDEVERVLLYRLLTNQSGRAPR